MLGETTMFFLTVLNHGEAKLIMCLNFVKLGSFVFFFGNTTNKSIHRLNFRIGRFTVYR